MTVNLILAFGIYAASMIKAVFDLRKARKKLVAPPEHICLFCYTEAVEPSRSANLPPKKDRGFVPICYMQSFAYLLLLVFVHPDLGTFTKAIAEFLLPVAL